MESVENGYGALVVDDRAFLFFPTGNPSLI